ncbi:hypothetical protein HMPREF0201_01995 [Cedecea davisae DSM 4568]|uniref:Uncharacterized protein n=1 Tax=Cedecea davisae DSM 4568 TaxID=566551 RepID=S3IVB3_9ENTR|nr:hypothetical protein HMPREF0201_01995 [Cedecea davisae DSM 4568]
MAQEAAVAIHQPGNQRGVRRGAGYVAADHAGRVVDIDRFVTVLFNGFLQAAADEVKRLIPTDALELPFAALAHSLHRVIQAFRVVDATANGAPAQAGANLMIAIVIQPGIIGFDPVDLFIADVQAQRAAAAAVDRTGSPDHFIFLGDGTGNGGCGAA